MEQEVMSVERQGQKNREQRIIELLKEITAVPSLSSTMLEKQAAPCVEGLLKGLAYFKENPGYCRSFSIPGELLERKIVYGLLRGEGKKTVVLMNHYDVVGIEDYGKAREYAFDIDKLPKALEALELKEDARKDLQSGEWIFGRGAADMKGGLAVSISCLEAYSMQEDRKGNLLFLSVPDEESYSVGMREAVKLLQDLKEQYQLEYEFLIDPEPNNQTDGAHIIPVGTGGKCMPVVMVQGEKAHISKCFDGLNPIGILGEIFTRTELSLEFSDLYDKELTVPPTWNYFKDMKAEYDVSIPIRACGYFSVISFTTTPDEILDKLRAISAESFQAYVDKMKHIYTEYKAAYKHEMKNQILYEPRVMTYQELIQYCQNLYGAEFNRFYYSLYEEIKQKLRSNEINYPQAAIKMMEELLNYSGIRQPLVLLGFAPPYYQPVNSFNIKNKGNKAKQCFEALREYADMKLQLKLETENYTPGLSDCSYVACEKSFDYQEFSENIPLWGTLYDIDFKSIEELNIPFFIMGPYGKDYHQFTERVNKKSLCEELPRLMDFVIRYYLKEEL